MGSIGAVLICFTLLVHNFGLCDKKFNKYSAEANTRPATPSTDTVDSDVKNLHRPFRMAKLNLVWAKAQHRLTEPKLKSLYTALKIHDKEEIAWKQLNAQHKDKEGLKEAELRQKLIGIMSSYDLLEHFEDTQDPAKVKEYRKYVDPHTAKSMFKDKRLNKLWEKAEVSGFTPEELKVLKEEFQHHQDRVDMYHNLLNNLGEQVKDEKHKNVIDEDHVNFNEITKETEDNNIPSVINKDYVDNINLLRDHHRDIQRNYEKLELLTANGPSSADFIEPKVQDLWKLALSNNFSDEDLLSLRHELNHYEARLIKLRNLRVEHAIQTEKYKNKKEVDKGNRFEEMEERIKKQARKAEKLYEEIEKKISKHTEL